MRKKMKPDLDLEEMQNELIETVCFNYKNGVSVRSLAKSMGLSPMKTRKILITGGVYSTDLSTEIGELYKDGKTVGEIASILNTTSANVNSYLPYERIVYNMEEKSVEADRQARYRERLRSSADKEKQEDVESSEVAGSMGAQNKLKTKKKDKERVRYNTMIFVIGKKLRRMLPDGVFDATSDPLARDRSYTWGSNASGTFVMHEATDPDRMIWCAEATVAGRGRDKKVGVVLESANCGFIVISPLPTPPVPSILPSPSTEEYKQMSWTERHRIEEENRKLLQEYRQQLEEVFLTAIRDGMLKFCLPENRVLDYTDTVARVEMIKGKISTPSVRLEEFIKNELDWDAGDNPVAQYNIRSNWTTRKFGNGDYRHVDAHTCVMLGMGNEECQKWIFDFLEPVSAKLSAVKGQARSE